MTSWEEYDYGCVWMATLYLPGSEKDRIGVSVHDCSNVCVDSYMQIIPGTGNPKPDRESVKVKKGTVLNDKLTKTTYFWIRYKQPIRKTFLRRYVGRFSDNLRKKLRQKCQNLANRRKRRQ